MSANKDFRDALFEAEPTIEDRRRRFHEEMGRILEPQLPRAHRWYYIAVLISSFIGLAGVVPSVIFDQPHRAMWAIFAVGLCASIAWNLRILRRNAEPILAMQALSKAAAGLGILLAAFLIVYGIQNPSLTHVLWAMLGLLICLVTIAINLWNRMIISERTLRENILRVEYRVAEQAPRSAPPVQQ